MDSTDKASKSVEERVRDFSAHGPWFNFYNPYRSAFTAEIAAFRDPSSGKPLQFHRRDGSATLLTLLADIAAFYKAVFGPVEDKAAWDAALKGVKARFVELRDLLPMDRIAFVGADGKPIDHQVDKADLSRFDVLSICWKRFLEFDVDKGPDSDYRAGAAIYCQLWCFVAMAEIDGAVLALLHEDAGSGIGPSIRAATAFANARILTSVAVDLESESAGSPQQFRLSAREAGLKGLATRWAKDEQQQVKPRIQQAWEAWQRGDGVRYQGQKHFAEDMVARFPAARNADTVQAWVRSWKKSAND